VVCLSLHPQIEQPINRRATNQNHERPTIAAGKATPPRQAVSNQYKSQQKRESQIKEIKGKNQKE
jgi:hypothetical protein